MARSGKAERSVTYCCLHIAHFKSVALPAFAGYAGRAGALDPVVAAAPAFAGGYIGDEVRSYVVRRFCILLAQWRMQRLALA